MYTDSRGIVLVLKYSKEFACSLYEFCFDCLESVRDTNMIYIVSLPKQDEAYVHRAFIEEMLSDII